MTQATTVYSSFHNYNFVCTVHSLLIPFCFSQEAMYMLHITLLLDIMYNFVKEILLWKSLGQAGMILTAATFCILFCTLLLVSLYGLRFKIRTSTLEFLLVWILERLPAVLYFYSNNSNYILQRYGGELNCGEKCQERNRTATKVLLALALVAILQTRPLPYKKKTSAMSENKDKQDGWCYMQTIASLVKIDMVYTFTTLCPATTTTTNVILLVLFTIVGIIVIKSNWTCLKCKAKTDNNNEEMFKKCIVLNLIVLLFLCVILPLHLLSNNRQPLDHAFGCDNTTMSIKDSTESSCKENANIILRLVFMAIIGLQLLVAGIYISICKCIKHYRTLMFH